MNREIILASTSPRRRDLMQLLKIKFKIVDSGYEEIMHKHLSHSDLVKFLAVGKAKAASIKYPNAIIITADTIVSFQGRAIGKPKNKKENILMLQSFSGKTQEVITGVVVLDARSNRILQTVVRNKILFKNLKKKEIKKFVDSNEGLDKAGGYGPLGGGISLIEKLEGDYTSAIGLPMGFVFNSLSALGYKSYH